MTSWRNQGHRRVRDNNELQIVAGLRAQGLHVFRIDEPADLAIYSPHVSKWFILEIKNPETHTRSKGKDPRTKQQKELNPEVQQGIGVVYSLVEALRWINRRSYNL